MAFLEAIPAAGRLLKVLAPLAGSAALITAGFGAAEAYEHKVPWGLAAKRAAAVRAAEGWRAAAQRWEATSRGWRASRDASERLRGQEQAQAVQAVTAQAQACDARVARARASAAAISTLINKEPQRDPNGCPVPGELLDARELRDALAPRAR